MSLLGGFGEVYGTTIAIPAIAEKGYMDLLVEVSSPGGHSSVPPKHTVGPSNGTYGVLAHFIAFRALACLLGCL